MSDNLNAITAALGLAPEPIEVADSFRAEFSMTMAEVDAIESNPLYPVAIIQQIRHDWEFDDEGDARPVKHDPPRLVAHPRTIETLREMVRRRKGGTDV